MARNRKPVVRRKRSSSSRRRSRSRGNLARFLKAFSSSALLAFGLGSFILHPQWRDQASLTPLLAQWGWPQQEAPALAAPVSGTYVQTNFAPCRQFFPASGTPLVPSGPGLRELCFDSFAILHNGRSKTPVFVAQRLNRQMIQQARNVERRDRFYADARLPAAERAELADYRNSGYSRGHMAPAGDMHTPQAMEQSFSLANMVPQNQVQNAGAWNRIEQDTRKYIMRAQGDVYVFTGPVYGSTPARIGQGRVAVPDHLYKVVHDARTGRTWVHWQANSEAANVGPPISYPAFVQRTGLHLLGAPGG
ncbi:MAG: DNA/RNA non-specific endonuclease [Alcaligenaceae bacterium]|nr:DNA/RNA non-specific endonuclease [Alcaligenaceae bacterium]